MSEFVVVRFRNATGDDVSLSLKWSDKYEYVNHVLPVNGRYMWWLLSTPQFWTDYQVTPPACGIAISGGGVGPIIPVPKVSIVQSDGNPTWDTPSEVNGKVQVNVIKGTNTIEVETVGAVA